ncbi:DUF2834 domain-containing protein [Ketobacter alkanivorans]|nr:DUF2834 domain-containing protein [Ketobacter alkanivorans]MCP5017291.1 DUF2834 domain-containing protein [Ketobacter sp.]
MQQATGKLFYLYLALGVMALVLTWVHLGSYMGKGIVDANILFWKDALFNANPASTFLAVDILFFALVGNIWMVIESRRLQMKFVWVYVAIGTFIGISFGFPLFLAMREKHLAAISSNTNVALKTYDVLGLLALGAVTVATGVWLYLK